METTLPDPHLDTDLETDTSLLPDDGLNPRQRKFADLYLDGHFACRAAILAGYSQDNASRIATRLLKTPAIADYLADARERLSNEHFYSRRLLIDWLWKAVHTSIDQIAPGDNLIQEQFTREFANGNRSHRVKLVNKLAAFRQLARMLGFDQPELTLPGNLARAFQAFVPANSGVAPPPLHRPPGVSLPGRDRFASVPPAKILRILPSGPAGTAHPTSHAEGPDPSPLATPSLQSETLSPDDPAAPSTPPSTACSPEIHPQTPPNPSTAHPTSDSFISPSQESATHSPSNTPTPDFPPPPGISTSEKLDISGHFPALPPSPIPPKLHRTWQAAAKALYLHPLINRPSLHTVHSSFSFVSPPCLSWLLRPSHRHFGYT